MLLIYLRCGLRGGYTELTNVPDQIKDNIFKLRNFDICPNIVGQVIVFLFITLVRLLGSSSYFKNSLS
jgi:hypothetical protein